MDVNSALWVFPVLLAAILHAGWDALVKSSGDPLAAQTVLIATSGLICLLALFFVGWTAAGEVPFPRAG